MSIQPLPDNQNILSSSTAPQRISKKNSGIFNDVLTQVQKADVQVPLMDETYTVRAGDSLYRIANQLKKTHPASLSPGRLVSELTNINKLSNPNLIFQGQVLRIPTSCRSNASVPNPGTALPDITTQPTTPATLSAAPGVMNLGLPFFLPARQELPAVPPPGIEKVAYSTLSAPIEKRNPSMADSPSALTKPVQDWASQIAIYKEDQLLAHPGGDYHFLNRDNKVFDPSYDQSRFVNRVGKDLADAGENLLNIAKDLTMGSSFKYMGKDGKIKNGQRVGLMGTVKNFFEDLLSGFSFGAYVPDGEKAPEGVAASLWHFVKKVFYDAPVKDLLVGVPHAVINVVKDAAFASLNLLEVVPDATIGNFEWGQKLTTNIFDNGQVAIDYLTDILPGGNAWLRVHAAGANDEVAPPILYNLKTAGNGVEDSRWITVRDTSFRKTIETIGSLLSDAVAVITVASQVRTTSTDQRKPQSHQD